MRDDLDLSSLNELGQLTSYETTSKEETLERMVNSEIIVTNIKVKNVIGYSTSSVVQHTFSMMFYLLGKLEYHNRQVKSKAWSKSGLFTDISQPFSELSTKT